MDEERIRELLEAVRSQQATIDEALQKLRQLPYETVGDFARLDHHRELRQGFPEVILAQGKTPDHVVQIFRRLAQRNTRVLATRVTAEMYAAIRDQLPEATYHPPARLLYLDRSSHEDRPAGIVVACAGTADIPVAEEAAITAEMTGSQVERIYDVGVAGLHRLLDQTPALQRARVLVVVAGMEGALASVVAGLVSSPVIAVPTSVGYGASFNGLAALLAMLNSCANGVAVVNIDNGFGAGYMAGMINKIGRKSSIDEGPGLPYGQYE
ncbi:MAG: nickel pincer cofactor biosynthesis protein LarB [Chloroflexi bacterium]|nr:nickel pincer cofactor biosynthesis protein LarB [Chloroflexota bacterium]